MSDDPNSDGASPIDPYQTSDQPPPPSDGASTGSYYRDEEPGEMLGPFKLLQRLGKGGMGVVWMAEQKAPVHRYVAVKIVKSSMQGSQVIARFEAERQALAMMDHPNIAKVLDAGTTTAGRPYFVMELVKGLSFTKYCDQEKLTLKDRLELFIPVCNAVQHAHQKGVIHRDLKPSNVLIALYDGKPVPKVIDFGVAKATRQKLTEKTMFTEVGQIVGTLEYMAPEQAELNNLDIDTRADIYSLGVMLYEVLTGSVPLSSKDLRAGAWDEMLRMIREIEPSKPSTKISASRDLQAIAATRKLEPKSLPRFFRGDLDWIVMKCLEKERARRYDSANQLAEELRRFLSDEPVLAGPPSVSYRARKFFRRNKGGVIAASLVFAALVLGVIGTSVASVVAWNAAEAERHATKKALDAQADERKAKFAALEAEAKEKAAAEKARALAKSEEAARKDADNRLKQVEEANALLEGIFADADPRLEQKLPVGVELLRDIEYGKGGGRALKMHLVRPKIAPKEPMPVVVWVHGGAWIYGHRDGGIERLAPLAERGYLGASIEYRLSQEAVFPAQIEDAKCAIRFLRAKAKDYHLDPNRIGVWGYSAGGHLVSLLGTSPHVKKLEGSGGWADQSSRVQAVCDLAGPADFLLWGGKAHPAVAKLLGGPVKDQRERAADASAVTHITKDLPPFLIIHGEKDKTVPIEQARALHDALKKVGADVTLKVLPNVGHNLILPETDKMAVDFFDKHLKAAK